jgi:hypothetical protein
MLSLQHDYFDYGTYPAEWQWAAHLCNVCILCAGVKFRYPGDI